MCIRAGSNEFESVKNLMGMSLMAVIAEALDRDIDEIAHEARLVEDLGMTAEGRAEMEEMIADVFDGLEVNLNRLRTVGALFDCVVNSQFEDSAVRHYARIPESLSIA